MLQQKQAAAVDSNLASAVAGEVTAPVDHRGPWQLWCSTRTISQQGPGRPRQ
jgi:hypothetical protein